jgi:O-acetyl-ADP-ribose deacetylase (regulator of RNase III)
MSNLHFVKGDATNPQHPGHNFIVHCCNDINAFGAGFVLALSKRYPLAKTLYHKWFWLHTKEPGQLSDIGYVSGMATPGHIQVFAVKVHIGGGIYVCNLIGQHQTGIHQFHFKNNVVIEYPPVLYDAITLGLLKLRKHVEDCYNYVDKSICMPRIGCGLAGGEWNKIEECIHTAFEGSEIPIYVYDLK